jgi:tricorn protease
MAHDGLEGFRMRWSPDSRWLTYARPTTSANNAVFVYDMTTAKLHQVTSGYSNDTQPTFEPEGKYLVYASDREFEPVYGSFDNSWTYPNPTRLVAITLRKDVKSPLEARNDAENPAIDTNKKDDTKKPSDEKDDKKDDKKEEPAPKVNIDLDGFESRAIVLPPKAGNYADLQAIKGKFLYRRTPRSGSGEEKSPLVWFDLTEREEKTVLDDADGFEATADGKKMLVVSKKKYAMVEIKAAQKFEKPMATGDLEATVNPRAEWRQLFNDVFRFERDFFYDPNMHGVDWAGLRARYGELMEDAVTRWDEDFVLGEFIGELNASHTYQRGDRARGESAQAAGAARVRETHPPGGREVDPLTFLRPELEPPQGVVAEEDVDRANRAFADGDSEEAFAEVDPEHAADIADQVGRHERKEAPANDDRHLVPLKRGLQLLDARLVLACNELLEVQRLGEEVDAGRRDENAE